MINRLLMQMNGRLIYLKIIITASRNVITVILPLSYHCVISFLQTDCPDFTVDKSVTASPGSQAGSEGCVEVCFGPHQLGEVKGELSLSSGSGGEYIFPLHGVCLPPKAQGPFSIRAGRNITIPFKNVFLQTATFSFQVKKQ